MLIDTHAHLNFNAFNDDREEVIKRTLTNNVWIINIGTNFLTSKKAVELAQNYPKGVFAAIGLHPINLETGLVKMKIDPAEFSSKTHGASELEGTRFEKEFDYEKYKELVKSEKVVAIGEIGLDYYWRPKTTKKKELFKEKQKELFEKQLKLAKELNLPVILHCRMAHDDLINILDDKKCNNFTGVNLLHRGVIHCFTGSWTQAEKYLEMGFYLGFNGLIFSSFAKASEDKSSFAKSYGGSAEASSEGGKMDFDEIIKKTPLEKILIETDCPYLTPPLRGNERNEPLYVKYIAQKIAEIKGESYEKVAEKTSENAKKLFNLR